MTGAELLLNVFDLSLSAGAMILVLLLLRSGLARRYSARWRCVVWLLLAVRLMIPLPLESGFVRIELPQRLDQPQYGKSAVYQSPQRDEEPAPEPEEQKAQEEGMGEKSELPTAPEDSPRRDAAPLLLEKAGPSLLSVACGMWGIGMVLCAAGQLLRYFVWRRQTLRWNKPVENTSLLEQLAAESRSAGLARPPKAYCNAKLGAPLVLGYFHPILLLPEDFESEPAAGPVLRHECIHLRRGDLFWKLLLLAAACMHWFNPLVWMMRRAAHHDLELACDEVVLAGRDSAHRILYGYALLEHAKKPAKKQRPFTARCEEP